MEFVLMAVGRTSIGYVNEGIAEYSSRLKTIMMVEALHTLSIQEIKDVKGGSGAAPERQKQLEGEAILSKINTSDMLVLLDERGREYTSMQFAAYLEKLQVCGRKRIVFLIVGPYGFSDKVYERADAKISLSKMTFNHEMVRLFFVEQIYRGMTILRGEPYHHE